MMTVYDPEGTAFEVSPINAKDLVQINGWTFQKPVIKIVNQAEPEVPAEEPSEEEAADEAPAEEAADEAPAEEAADEAPAEEAADEAPADESPEEEAAAPYTTVEQFEALERREDVVAYLAEHFPDFTPHHLHKRETLIEKAIELATAGE